MSDTEQTLRDLRRQVEDIDRAIAQLQGNWPIAMPRPTRDFGAVRRSFDDYQRPGRPQPVAPAYVPTTNAQTERQAKHDANLREFMRERRFNMTDKLDRKEYARRVFGKD